MGKVGDGGRMDLNFSRILKFFVHVYAGAEVKYADAEVIDAATLTQTSYIWGFKHFQKFGLAWYHFQNKIKGEIKWSGVQS